MSTFDSLVQEVRGILQGYGLVREASAFLASGINASVTSISVDDATPLAAGIVEIDGRRYEAFARHGHSAKGERLDVVDVDNFRLIVSKPSLPVSSS